MPTRASHNEWNVRRVRLGPRITFFRDYLVHAEVELNPQEHDPFYVRMTDVYVAWQKHPEGRRSPSASRACRSRRKARPRRRSW